MTDDDLRAAVEAFLDAADDHYEEYDQGYADADATLRKLREPLAALREAVED